MLMLRDPLDRLTVHGPNTSKREPFHTPDWQSNQCKSPKNPSWHLRLSSWHKKDNGLLRLTMRIVVEHTHGVARHR